VDLAGTLLLLLPMMIFLIVSSFDYVAVSWSIREGSREAGGLPFPFVPLLKSLMPVTAALVIVQAVAGAIANLITLTGRAARTGDAPADEAPGPD
jgi:TRAP-type mannitol/chloroaromatic compound transport system permease small subunit